MLDSYYEAKNYTFNNVCKDRYIEFQEKLKSNCLDKKVSQDVELILINN